MGIVQYIETKHGHSKEIYMIPIFKNIIKRSKKIHTQDYVLITRKLNHKSDKSSTTLLGKSKNNFIQK